MSRAEILQALQHEGRLESLRETDLMDAEPERAFDRLTRLAVRLVNVPVAYVALVADDKQYFKSCVGVPEPWSDRRVMPASESLCQHPVAQGTTFVVQDFRGRPELRDIPAVERLGLRAYVGIPLKTEDGHAVGSFCVGDRKPREWTDEEIGLLEDLAEGAATELQLRADRRRRERLEEKLRLREAGFRLLVDNAADVITVLDEDGVIRFESPSVKLVLGWAPEERVGESALEYVHPEDRPEIGRRMQEALSEPSRIHFGEFRVRHADGGWREVEATARALPRGAELDGLIATTRDVSERKALEERVRLLATAVEHAGNGVTITDAELDEPGPEIVYVNPAATELTGYAEDELLGETPRILQGPDTDRAVLDELRRRLEEGRTFEGEAVNYRKDGTPFYLHWKVAPVRNPEGEITHFVAVQQDVTERRQQRERLEEAVRVRTRDLRRSQREVLERLARAAEYRDDETGEHTRRVGAVVGLLAEAMGLSDERSALLRRTAPLHDLGKIGIPDHILLKPGKLTPDEFRKMMEHAEIGARLLAGGRSELVQMAEVIAVSHHERWDGSGYPRGLKGEEIPLPGRLVAVADVFDALTHRRPYKPAWPPEEAAAEVEKLAGTHFDPTVVEAFRAAREEILAVVEEGVDSGG